MDDAYKLSSLYEEMKYQQKYEEQEQTDTFNRRIINIYIQIIMMII